MEADAEQLPEHLRDLEAELRQHLAADDVPHQVLDGARGAWTWRLIDGELAELSDQEEAVLRADLDTLVTFATDEVFIDVDRVVDPDATSVVLVGQVTAPSRVTAVEVELAGDPPRIVAAELDEAGGFRVKLEADAPARLVVHPAGGRRVVSSWLR